MKWIKTFEEFDFNFDLYKKISFGDFRELVNNRKRMEPTESKLHEIGNVMQQNTKRDIIDSKLGIDVGSVEYLIFKDMIREKETEETSNFFFYSISLKSRHELSGLAEDYIYIIKTTDDFYLVGLQVLQNMPDLIIREPILYICDGLDGLCEFTKKELN